MIEIRDLIVDFIKEDQEICAAESLESSPLLPAMSGKISIRGINFKEQTLSNGEVITNLTKKSLLCGILSTVPDKYSQPIIKALISGSQNLSHRDDLMLIMIDQETISKGLDMSGIFDMLIEKNLPLPSDQQMEELMINSRLRSGNNASKLAAGFFNLRNESSLTDYVLRYEASNARRGPDYPYLLTSLKDEKENLKNSLAIKRAYGPEIFERKLHYFLEHTFEDKDLKTLLEHEGQDYLQHIQDHGKVLEFAVAKKLTKTFKILIDAGFDPRRHPEGQANIIAIACQTQSAKPIASYLAAIREKFSQDAVVEIINERDDHGSTALTHALEGKAFIDTIDILLKNGADYESDYYHNLTQAAQRLHAGAFDLLLRKKTIMSGHDLENFVFHLTNEDYVIDSIILENISDRDSALGEHLKQRIGSQIANLQESDIFRICQTGGDTTLRYYFSNMQARDETYSPQKQVLRMDEHLKTPLYYAVSFNAYNRMIELLLEKGANPNEVGREGGSIKQINALSIAVENNETETVSLLIRSGKMSSKSISEAAEILLKKEGNDNALLNAAFIENLPEVQLANLSQKTLQHFLFRSFESNLDESCISRIKNCRPDLNLEVNDLFSEAVKNGNPEKLTKLFRHFSRDSLLREKDNSNLSSEIDSEIDSETVSSSEKTSLLARSTKSYSSLELTAIDTPKPTPKISKPSPTTKVFSKKSTNLSQAVGTKYIDKALTLSQTAENQQEINNRKAVIEILLREGFKSSWEEKKFDQQLANLGINKNDCCSKVGCVIS